MRSTGGTSDVSAGSDRSRLPGSEIVTAVNPPGSEHHDGQAIGRVGVGCAVAGEPNAYGSASTHHCAGSAVFPDSPYTESRPAHATLGTSSPGGQPLGRRSTRSGGPADGLGRAPDGTQSRRWRYQAPRGDPMQVILADDAVLFREGTHRCHRLPSPRDERGEEPDDTARSHEGEISRFQPGGLW
jgi:hypothetical protein